MDDRGVGQRPVGAWRVVVGDEHVQAGVPRAATSSTAVIAQSVAISGLAPLAASRATVCARRP
ncbi:MAG: hypothetical protein R2736_12045 [Solirubrobacterales bacterium]